MSLLLYKAMVGKVMSARTLPSVCSYSLRVIYFFCLENNVFSIILVCRFSKDTRENDHKTSFVKTPARFSPCVASSTPQQPTAVVKSTSVRTSVTKTPGTKNLEQRVEFIERNILK